MKIPLLKEIIRTSPIVIHQGKYAYLKADEKNLGKHFLVSQDQDEITVVTEEKNIKSLKYSEITRWFKLFEVRVSYPFVAPGFIAEIAKAFASKKINILVVSTYSKDYLLIKEEDSKIAIEILKEKGFPVRS
jgi:hypothetical protein